MAASTSLGGVKTRPHRGTLSAAFALLPILIVILLMLPEPVALAASSVLEIEPPSEADAHHPSATPSEKILSRDKADDRDDSAGAANKTAQAAKDEQSKDADDSDDSDDIDATSNHAAASGGNAKSHDDADDDDDDDDDDQVASKNSSVPGTAAAADSSAVGNDKSSTSVQRDDADDDSDDDDDDDEVAHAPVVKDGPGLETRVDRETDSDGNDTITTSTVASTFVGDYLVGLRKDVVAAHDPLGSERAEASLISIHKDLSETFALSGAFGSYRTLNYNDFVGSFQAQWHAGDWSISAGITRDLLAKSAQSIRSNIRQTDFGLIASYDLTKHLSSDFEFHHRIYSDGNSSNDLAFSPVYEFALEKSQFDVGYSFNYRSFAMKAEHGYYDPRRLISNGLIATWKFDHDGYYGNVEASEGRADIKGASGGLGAANSAMCTSMVATLGLRPRKDMVVEGYWGGEWSAGWSSNALGLKIRYSF
jgi:hypothetical protein